jgi:hypothetical protein
MSKQNVSGPYQIELDDLERFESLDGIDLGEWYILINGAIQFTGTEERGHELKSMLSKLN